MYKRVISLLMELIMNLINEIYYSYEKSEYYIIMLIKNKGKLY